MRRPTLAARVGGRVGTEPDPEADDANETQTTPKGERPLHPALQTLLDPDGVGDVDPELAASEQDREGLAWNAAVETCARRCD